MDEIKEKDIVLTEDDMLHNASKIIKDKENKSFMELGDNWIVGLLVLAIIFSDGFGGKKDE